MVLDGGIVPVRLDIDWCECFAPSEIEMNGQDGTGVKWPRHPRTMHLEERGPPEDIGPILPTRTAILNRICYLRLCLLWRCF